MERGGEAQREAQRETDGKRVDVWIGINTGGWGTRRSEKRVTNNDHHGVSNSE